MPDLYKLLPFLMSVIIQLDSVSKRIGAQTLFEDVTFDIHRGDKAALLGINGAGKSTLLNIIADKDTCDHGSVKVFKGTSMAYLEQESLLPEDKTVMDALFQSDNELLKSIKNYEEALILGDMKCIEKTISEMDRLRIWDFETRIKQILTRLNITNFHQKIFELSGGQRKRVALANVLLSESDFLLLDEPTNHLDLEVIEWLEQFLSRSTLTLLMVTHDRYFLDRVCNKIFEIDCQQIYRYEGNYSRFVLEREKRIETEQLIVDKAQNILRNEEDWIRRMPKARGTKAKARVENYNRLKELSTQGRKEKQMNLTQGKTRMGSKVFVIKNIDFAWNGSYYIKDYSYTFGRLERIGILGDNGIGKTTFIELLTGTLKPEKGIIEPGKTIKIGYYRQEGLQFDENMRVLDAVAKIAETVTLADGSIVGISQFLNYFLFPPRRQHDYIYKLSGGEKRRLYLCQVLMQNPNFLILDEPTNDLDIASLQVLEEYLISFKGCVMVVSHDRYFIDRVVDHLFVFEGDGKIKDFPGNYSTYIEWNKNKKDVTEPSIIRYKMNDKPVKTGKIKLTYNERRELKQLEIDIESLESEKLELEKQLSSGILSKEELIEKSQRIGIIMSDLDTKTDHWLELSEKI